MMKGSPVTRLTRSTCSSSSLDSFVGGGGDLSCASASFRIRQDDSVDQLEVMLSQEDGPYRCRDYLARAASSSSGRSRRRRRGGGVGRRPKIDAAARAKMVDWTYRVSNCCGFDVTTVPAVAFSLLDRYLDTDVGSDSLYSRRSYQLSAVTAFYVAVKMTEREAVMGLDIAAALSRGQFGEDDIVRREMDMLTALEWRVGNAPTPAEFLRRYFEILLPHDNNKEAATEERPLLDCALAQAELAVREYDLSVNVRPSVVAYAALLNAIFAEEGIVGRRPARFLWTAKRVLSQLIEAPPAMEVAEVRKRLWEGMSVTVAVVEAAGCDNAENAHAQFCAAMPINTSSPSLEKSREPVKVEEPMRGTTLPQIEGLVITVPSTTTAAPKSRCRREGFISRQGARVT